MKKIQIGTVLLIILSGLWGCATQNAAKRIAAFSEATTLVTQNASDAFETVDRKYFDVQVARAVINYDKGFDPHSIKPFLNPEELQVRLTVLKGLQRYSEKLSMIMGNEQLDKFDKQTQDLGASLTSINEDLVKKQILKVQPVDANEIRVFTTSVNTLGRWFIDYKRTKDVKVVIGDMQEPVSHICDLLIKDIGMTRDDPGLRNQLWNQYEQSMTAQDEFIQHSNLDPLSKRDEIKALIQLAVEQKQADATFEGIETSLEKFKEAHAKLMEAFNERTSIEIDNLIAQLTAEGERVKDFYDRLDRK